MHLKRFNSQGVAEFRAMLISLKEGSKVSPDYALLESAQMTEKVLPTIAVDNQKFANRFAAAEYLNGIVSGIRGVERDAELWAWLTLFFFDAVCPPAGGMRKIYEEARYIPAPENFRKYYRHLLAGPYRIYHAHRNNPRCAMAALCNPLHAPGDVAENLSARQEIVACPAIMETATRLYLNEQTQRLKSRAAGKGQGGSRRFVTVLQQFDLTYDLYKINSEDILKLLPEEFDEFR